MRHRRTRLLLLFAATISIQVTSDALDAADATAGRVGGSGSQLGAPRSWRPPFPITQPIRPNPGRPPGLIPLPGPSPEQMAESFARQRKIRQIHLDGVEKGKRLTTTLEIESMAFLFDPQEVEKWVSCSMELQRSVFGEIHPYFGSTKNIARMEGAPRALHLTAKLRLKNSSDEPVVIWTGLDPKNGSLDFDVRIQTSPNSYQRVTVDRYFILEDEPKTERQVMQPGESLEIPFEVVLAGSWSRYGHSEEEFQVKIKYRSGFAEQEEATEYTYVEPPTLTIPGERRASSP